MKTSLEKFYGLIEEINVAMMTTRPDGHLESRAMANQKQAAIRATAQPTTLGSSSSALTSMPPCSSRSTSPNRSFCSNWQRAGSREPALKRAKRHAERATSVGTERRKVATIA